MSELFPENPEYETYLKRKDPRKLDGIYTVRWRNGNLRQQMTYKNGVLHGTFTEWDKAGNVVGRVEFVKGKPVDPTGR